MIQRENIFSENLHLKRGIKCFLFKTGSVLNFVSIFWKFKIYV